MADPDLGGNKKINKSARIFYFQVMGSPLTIAVRNLFCFLKILGTINFLRMSLDPHFSVDDPYTSQRLQYVYALYMKRGY
jgi:hypothetical protein